MNRGDKEKFEALRNRLIEDANYQRELAGRAAEDDEFKEAIHKAIADGIDRARRELEKTLYNSY